MVKARSFSSQGDLLRVAQLAAMEAGDYALKQFTRIHVLKEKPMSKDQVTRVDLRNERLILKVLRKNFPEHSIFTEERRLPQEKREYVWWIDPLDGSVSYFFGLPYWGISLALIYQGEPLIGVLFFPQTRDLYWSIKGGGAWRNYKKIQVSSLSRLESGIMAVDYGYQTERLEGVIRITQKIADRVKYLVTYGCTIGALTLVAEGKLSGYIHHMARRFDLAAGGLLITEAGGRISDTNGRPIDWLATEPVHFMASNGRVHRQLIKVLR